MFAVPPNTIAHSVTPATSHPALIALELAADVQRWSHAVGYHADGHDRWLMSWLPGQRTDWHTHDGSIGAFTVVAGALTERVTRTPGDRVQHRVEPGQTRVFGPSYVHQLINDRGYPAIIIMCTRSIIAAGSPIELPTQRTRRRPPRPGSGEAAAA
jgi:mannose-6-phosphate isomerase-like protein (cupin superfamily)